MDFSAGTTSIDTPCLVIDDQVFSQNIATMQRALPGPRLRPHVKAFKSTALARRLVDIGHSGFTCATPLEAVGMARAGMANDLLLANESLNIARLKAAADAASSAGGTFTTAVDSVETIDAAARAGVTHALIDVCVGLPRCGCPVDVAGTLADRARQAGLDVRGVMGYEGHLMMIEDRHAQAAKVAASMDILIQAAEAVGGDVISAGGTGTYDINHAATEIQAGSYTLMDTDYARLDRGFAPALWLETTVIAVHRDGWIVVDGGLKALALDHGNPTWPFGEVMFCSDEHTTLSPSDPGQFRVGDRTRLLPGHVDPTIAKHQAMWLLDSASDPRPIRWDIDLRHW